MLCSTTEIIQLVSRKRFANGKANARQRKLWLPAALDPAKGYSEQQRGFYDEARSPTRLGEDSRVVRLAKWQDGKLTAWADGDGDENRAWRMSEIQLRAYKAHARGIYAPEIEKVAETIERAWLGRLSMRRDGSSNQQDPGWGSIELLLRLTGRCRLRQRRSFNWKTKMYSLGHFSGVFDLALGAAIANAFLSFYLLSM